MCGTQAVKKTISSQISIKKYVPEIRNMTACKHLFTPYNISFLAARCDWGVKCTVDSIGSMSQGMEYGAVI